MATRAIIAFGHTHETAPGRTSTRARWIYCHYDGYPSRMLHILNAGYRTAEKAGALMDLGNLMMIGLDLGERRGPGEWNDGACVAYGRDFGDAGPSSGEVFYVGPGRPSKWLGLSGTIFDALRIRAGACAAVWMYENTGTAPGAGDLPPWAYGGPTF